MRGIRRQQGQLRATGRGDDRQITILRNDHGFASKRRVPRYFQFVEQFGDVFALYWTQCVVGYGQMPISVEPHFANREVLRHFLEKFERAVDMVDIDVRNDEKLDMTRTLDGLDSFA